MAPHRPQSPVSRALLVWVHVFPKPKPQMRIGLRDTGPIGAATGSRSGGRGEGCGHSPSLSQSLAKRDPAPGLAGLPPERLPLRGEGPRCRQKMPGPKSRRWKPGHSAHSLHAPCPLTRGHFHRRKPRTLVRVPEIPPSLWGESCAMKHRATALRNYTAPRFSLARIAPQSGTATYAAFSHHHKAGGASTGLKADAFRVRRELLPLQAPLRPDRPLCLLRYLLTFHSSRFRCSAPFGSCPTHPCAPHQPQGGLPHDSLVRNYRTLLPVAYSEPTARRR